MSVLFLEHPDVSTEFPPRCSICKSACDAIPVGRFSFGSTGTTAILADCNAEITSSASEETAATVIFYEGKFGFFTKFMVYLSSFLWIAEKASLMLSTPVSLIL